MKINLEIKGFPKHLELFYKGKNHLLFLFQFLFPYFLLYVSYLIIFKFWVEENHFLVNYSHDKLMLYILYTNLFHFFAASLTLGISFATLGGSIRRAFILFIKISRYYKVNITPSKGEDENLKNVATHFNNLLSSYNLRFKHIRKNVLSIQKSLVKLNSSKSEAGIYDKELEQINRFLENYSK